MGLQFGRVFANRIRQRAPRSGANGIWMRSSSTSPGKHWLWRAVDQEGSVLDVLVQCGARRRPPNACSAGFSKSKVGSGILLVTDKLKSYAAGKRETMLGVAHRQHKGLDKRAENSHQPTGR
jgi:putative transposase